MAVRDKPSHPQPRKLPVSSNSKVKIIAHSGDLSYPLLGLSEDEFTALSQDADLIVHMGAVHSFWDHYHALRPTNVHSTRELIKLAAPRRIPIHYISSGGVLPTETDTVQTSADANAVPSSVAAYYPPVDGTNGYVATRWASERILERSAAELGLPVVVHRFVPSANASPATSSILDEFTRFVDLSDVMPDFSAWSGRIDIIATEEAARWLCDALTTELEVGIGAAGTGIVTATPNCRFRHCESPIVVDVAELTTHLEQQRVEADRELERMPAVRWIGRIKALGFGYFFAGQEVVVRSNSAGGASFKSRR